MWIWIVVIVIVVLILSFIGMYNSLVSDKQRVEHAWANIDTQLKKRFDLIPNLVETVKGYAAHEKSTLEAVIKARNTYVSAAGSVEGSMEAEKSLNSSLKQLFALSESYPELKANENFKALQVELTGTEDKIAYARQFYNDAVRMYNEKLLKFPSNIVASMFKAQFTEAKYFEADSAERENVKVQF